MTETTQRSDDTKRVYTERGLYGEGTTRRGDYTERGEGRHTKRGHIGREDHAEKGRDKPRRN